MWTVAITKKFLIFFCQRKVMTWNDIDFVRFFAAAALFELALGVSKHKEEEEGKEIWIFINREVVNVFTQYRLWDAKWARLWQLLSAIFAWFSRCETSHKCRFHRYLWLCCCMNAIKSSCVAPLQILIVITLIGCYSALFDLALATSCGFFQRRRSTFADKKLKSSPINS